MNGKKQNNCSKCNNLFTPNPIKEDIIFGTNDVLIVGEFPKGNLKNFFESPTARNLANELEKLNIKLNECNFTELCKCELPDRKLLKKAGTICIDNLLLQIKELKPKLIITIGIITKEIFEEVFNITIEIGNVITLNSIQYLPLYHPSPVNPKGHNNNKEIIKTLDMKNIIR